MITLYQPPAAWGMPNISPFCVKVETYLRMTRIEYKRAGANILKAPNGRVPYVDIDGQVTGDSTLIIRRLKELHGDPLDEGLSSEQKAHALLLQRLVEDHLYFATAYLRFSQDFSWKHLQDFWRPHFPPVLGELILRLMRKGMMKTLRTQGLGEHDVSNIVEFAKDDLTAISDSLGNKSFFLGDQPTSVDAVMYGFLIHQLWTPWECPIKEHAQSLKNLTAYCERMKQKYWS